MQLDICSHGVRKSHVCWDCVTESKAQQEVWKFIAGLMANSRYRRSIEGPECTVESGERVYVIRMLRAKNENMICEVQKLLEETFGEDEVDPIEVLKAAINGTLPDGSKDLTRYRLYVASDSSGKIQSIYAGGIIEMMDTSGKPTRNAMFMGAYGITRRESRGLGIMRELYISSMMQAAVDAHLNDKKFCLIAGETTSDSERVWNALGRARVYVETRSNEYTELPYIQPALEFDPQTGLPAIGAGEVPEHLMVQFLRGTPDKQQMVSAIDSMYRWCNTYTRGFFASHQAYQNHKAYIASLQNSFNEFMFDNGELRLLSSRERDNLRRQGVVVIDHIAVKRALKN